jgi:GNAT superfamily N-acetyltransferase
MVYIRHNEAGDIGWVIQQLAKIYQNEYGRDKTFESFVAEICTKFIIDYDPQKERCWIAEKDGQRLGCIFCVNDSDGTAKLRMLLVTRETRGLGVGSCLVDECIRFAQQSSYRGMALYTNDILVEVRHIHQKAGFKLTN